MWFKSKGWIDYDPKRPDLKEVDSKGRGNRNSWWCIAHIDPEICRYYRWWVNTKVLNPLRFDRRKEAIQNGFHYIDLPSWGPHISIIRGERPSEDLMHLWRKYHRQEIEFEYSHVVRQTSTEKDGFDNYWFVEVRSDFLTNIRRELNRPCNWNLHITVGRTWN
jgi:hypothetical protein